MVARLVGPHGCHAGPLSIRASANRSASAAMVSDGLAPTGPGMTEPSATNSRGQPKTSPDVLTTPRPGSLAMGQPPSGWTVTSRLSHQSAFVRYVASSARANSCILSLTRLKYGWELWELQSSSRNPSRRRKEPSGTSQPIPAKDDEESVRMAFPRVDRRTLLMLVRRSFVTRAATRANTNLATRYI